MLGLDYHFAAEILHAHQINVLDKIGRIHLLPSIHGSIPSSLGYLSKLSFVSLFNNSLTGRIPPSLGNLSSLQHLDLYRNQLEGSMPEEIGNHPSLEYLQVPGNKLSGELPASLFNLSETCKGPIPASLPNASKLYIIDMSNNKFNGIIPSGLGRLRGLSVVKLEYNQLEANDHSSWQFLDALTNCSHLKILSLLDNKLSGTLPQSIANLSTTVQWVTFNFNQISGSIPSGIGNLVNLITLTLGSNLLTGAIPESIGKLARLELLNLNHNMLTKTLPSSIGNLTQLEYLRLENNGFEGPIPPSIGNLNSLAKLIIHENNLNGNIPKEVFGLPSILILSLAFNSLTGPIPSEIAGWKYLRELYFHENSLFGEIPISMSACVRLEVLDLSSNFIQGTIPPSMGDLKGLIRQDLSKNYLTGKIPEALGMLRSLEYLNFSFNRLVGEVPREGIFRNTTATSLQGNYGLCGGVLDLHLPACPHISSSEKRRKLRLPLLAILLPSMKEGFYFVYQRRKFQGVGLEETTHQEDGNRIRNRFFLFSHSLPMLEMMAIVVKDVEGTIGVEYRLEDLNHIMYHCKFSKEVFAALRSWGFQLQCLQVDSRLEKEKVFDFTQADTLFLKAVYQIWINRNKKKHCDGPVTPKMVAANVLANFNLVNISILWKQWETNWLYPIEISWCPPPSNWLKINFDGAYQIPYRAGLGIVVRDAKGNLLVAAGKNILHWDVNFIELQSIALLKEVMNEELLGALGIIIEGDNQKGDADIVQDDVNRIF
ncbi:hypothetical protein M5K25_027686 [Dendrobium thyrsiflorum]|uniref:non-specific serine/threonine protein kinase n=1 Tax=Dendrobium thyrsiflorum TaxID=117978 RepID=A0ABD0TUG4_DENTH